MTPALTFKQLALENKGTAIVTTIALVVGAIVLAYNQLTPIAEDAMTRWGHAKHYEEWQYHQSDVPLVLLDHSTGEHEILVLLFERTDCVVMTHRDRGASEEVQTVRIQGHH